MIEALGLPHTEVDLIVRNGHPAGFDAQIAQDDVIEIYPAHHVPKESGAKGERINSISRSAGSTRSDESDAPAS